MYINEIRLDKTILKTSNALRGVENRKAIYIEEISELVQAILEYEENDKEKGAYNDKLLDHVAEELSDVIIIANCTKMILDVPTRAISITIKNTDFNSSYTIVNNILLPAIKCFTKYIRDPKANICMLYKSLSYILCTVEKIANYYGIDAERLNKWIEFKQTREQSRLEDTYGNTITALYLSK